MAGLVLPRVTELIYRELAGDGYLMSLLPGGVNRDLIPQVEKEYPAIVFQILGAQVARAAAGNRANTDALVEVRCICTGLNMEPLVPVADQAFAVLENASGQIDDVSMTVQLQEEFQRTSLEATNIPFQHLGGVFVVRCSVPILPR